MRRFACDAVLFDLDGVLVDSTAVVVKTWRVWAEKRGFDVERILQFAHGRKAAETICAISSDLDPDVEVEVLERLETENLEGVLEVEGGPRAARVATFGWLDGGNVGHEGTCGRTNDAPRPADAGAVRDRRRRLGGQAPS